ncbi:MAG TPA: arylesterase [Hyphomicrobiaceae bacterium]|mgnify:FL=1|nr:arylesterase [Hyphomicrobiaceae bacterium]
MFFDFCKRALARALAGTGLAVSLLAIASGATEARSVKLVAFGDSLTAGYQLPASQAFPEVLQRELKKRGHDVEVVNSGVSGDTTAAGLERLAWAVPDDADGVILELGANDALRGLSTDAARANLDRIVSTLVAARKHVLIAGMRAPVNLGEPYRVAFDSIFPDLATRHGTLLYPFFLEPIALKPELNLADGIHPNQKGVEAIVAGILPKVEELIAQIRSAKVGAVK